MNDLEKEISRLRESIVIHVSKDDYRENFNSSDLRRQIMNAFGVKIEGFDNMPEREFSTTLISLNCRAIMAIPEDVWKEIEEEAKSMLLLHMTTGAYE